ncbi:hypothetical protein CKA32_006474 [Geitlerinema sp. FC II]|nr:hypothetical protein CKA32_006474 [Geitlerinema sp. FC II]
MKIRLARGSPATIPSAFAVQIAVPQASVPLRRVWAVASPRPISSLSQSFNKGSIEIQGGRATVLLTSHLYLSVGIFHDSSIDPPGRSQSSPTRNRVKKMGAIEKPLEGDRGVEEGEFRQKSKFF